MPWLVFVTLAGYGVVAGLTARLVFARARAAFVAGRSGAPAEWAEKRFEENERAQAETLALVSGLCWVVAVPVLALRRVVAVVVLARPDAERAATPPHLVGERIEELERMLGLGEHTPNLLPGDPPQPG
ncbi:hypothetical protein [Kitasatospora sp. A2-31]|uniref:hypothetical protein n=1 Tax=Kitasatospora sp. A2-31 TaxID=2916414 RepID=UPI001EEBCEF5|nr:hypothetical protein [Kitasatospora sp. A2-31]MCG6494393.1 hypothetical protein [Kitasatospora sp. A2-31]